MANIIEISDFSGHGLDIYARMTENQLLCRENPENALFIAESPAVVERALDAGCVPVSVLMDKKHLQKEDIMGILKRCKEIPVYIAQTELLRRLTGFGLTRGMLCAMKRPLVPRPEEICAGKHRIAVLERVMNPTNVGAVFRSAAAMGFEAVLLTRDSSNPLYRRAIRVSMGNVFLIPWAWIKDSGDLNGILQKMGFCTAAMALTDDSVPTDDPALMAEDRLAVLLGSENDGLTKKTILESDYVVRIPMKNGVDSLNVAAASAVAFWQLRKGKYSS